MRTVNLEMRKFSYPLVACLVLFLLASCNDFKHLSNRAKLMVKVKDNLFRGIDFDLSPEQVKQAEAITPDIEYPDNLRYKIGADSIAAGESLDVEYFFNKKHQLDLMIAFYNISDSAAIYPMVDELMRYLQREHGDPKKDELGWYHWEFPDNTGEPGTIEINLVGETESGYMGVELELIKYYAYEDRR